MTNKISWLHLSDIHIKKENAYDQDVVLSSMLEDIAVASDEHLFDVIFLTGDIAFSGKDQSIKRRVNLYRTCPLYRKCRSARYFASQVTMTSIGAL